MKRAKRSTKRQRKHRALVLVGPRVPGLWNQIETVATEDDVARFLGGTPNDWLPLFQQAKYPHIVPLVYATDGGKIFMAATPQGPERLAGCASSVIALTTPPD